MNKEMLEAIKRMCDIITNNTFGDDELDSLALHIGHHPDLLNPTSDNKDYASCSGCIYLKGKCILPAPNNCIRDADDYYTDA